MKVATNLALSGALMFWMAAFAQESVKPAAAPAQAPAAATTSQDCGKMMEKMHADKGGMKGMKSGEMMKSGCMNKDMSAADASASAKPDEHDHSAHSHK
jgi:hypothetical protein